MSRPSAFRPAPAAPAPFLAALAATALLLTGCGTEPAGAGDRGAGAAGSPSGTPVDDPGKDGVRVTSVTLPSPSRTPSDDYSVHADSLYSGISAAYEVTNKSAETLTYTVIITFQSADGGAMSNRTVTVRDVGPGRTVRGTVQAEALTPGAPRTTGARVLEVTKVPAAEAPTEPGACPASGIRVSVDRGDAAMGLRVVGLHLDNCGTRTYTVEGYPLLQLLDEDRKPVDGVQILEGSAEISTGAGPDTPPGPVTLKPGEEATSALVWRNTTQMGTAVNVPYVRVRAKAGADPVTVTPKLDLGTTGKLGVKPWAKAKP
ncbi:lipoprotein [Streptomyces sp. AcH 505]|uniref:DUF4232 domain-containing protein n=1 Tax=Streptomyces sp. AcH 505 TaxID=352211 RepID=UPI000592102F|nr:lipoprotein [Streptomyces sp. AcH 505]